MLPSFRQRLTLLLIIILPFHAFMVTVGTRLIVGTGHAPLPWLSLWKEGLLGVILVLALVEVVMNLRSGPRTADRGPRPFLDVIDWTILASILVGCLSSLFTLHSSLFTFLLGAKYDFLPLIAFLILRRVPWTQTFVDRLLKAILIIGTIVAGYGILTAFLPVNFFTWLGYSPIHSLYFSDGPIAAFQFIGNTSVRRIQSFMSGPNQLGLWLLIPLSMWLATGVRKKFAGFRFQVSGLLLAIALLLTFSRSAWIGAFAMIIVMIGLSIPARLRMKVVGYGVACIGILGIVLIALFPSIFGRLGSTRGHWERPMEAVSTMMSHPFGLGLGSAGPASNRGTDACVHLRPQDDPSWAKPISNLCVFLGTRQVQPLDRTCICPLLTENWYLQWGVEMGWAGLVLSVVLAIVVLRKLKMENPSASLRASGKWKIIQDIHHHFSLFTFHFSLILVFLALSLAALFLHAWEDSAVAWTVWILIAMQLQRAFNVPGTNHVPASRT